MAFALTFSTCTNAFSIKSEECKRYVSNFVKFAIPASIACLLGLKIKSYYSLKVINPVQLSEIEQQEANSKSLGLPNVGNSCYMNAAIQQLYAIDSFREAILNANVEAVNKTSEKSNKPYTHALKSIFSAMASENKIDINQMRFLAKELEHSGGQQDSIEYIQHITENCARELKSNSLNMPLLFEDLCLENNTEAIFKNNCKNYGNNNNLIVFIPRIDENYKMNSKNFKSIDMPYEKDIDKQGLFELSGVTVFVGSDNSGHYYTYQKKNDNSWVVLNDNKVKSVKLEDIDGIIKKNGVLYMYKKIGEKKEAEYEKK